MTKYKTYKGCEKKYNNDFIWPCKLYKATTRSIKGIG